MNNFTLNFEFTNNYVKDNINKHIEKAKKSQQLLKTKTGLGNEYLGWVELVNENNQEEINKILKSAKYIKENVDVLLVIGIGGSYLGAKAGLSMLNPYFNNKNIEVIFVGHNLSSTYFKELEMYLEDKRFAINVISKSGTTTEPAIAFRIFRNLLKEKLPNDYKKNIFITTDEEKGALKSFAIDEGIDTFIIKDDIGGRFSVLTPVGLLPLAASNLDIEEILAGAKQAYIDFQEDNNNAMLYAAYRNALLEKDYNIEIMVNFEEKLNYFSEWFKQLYGESEGKNHLGIYPSSASFSTDLHSLGQYIQDGRRNIFETFINIEKPKYDILLKENENNKDNLNYLKGKTLDYVNKQVAIAATKAHNKGKTPSIDITISEINEFNFGYLIYFFETACGISAYSLGVNPFDQPGVEEYKINMFELLDKPKN